MGQGLFRQKIETSEVTLDKVVSTLGLSLKDLDCMFGTEPTTTSTCRSPDNGVCAHHDHVLQPTGRHPVSVRAVTFSFLMEYMSRCVARDDANPADFDPTLTTYSLLEFVKNDTKRWNCSMAELALALDHLACANNTFTEPTLSYRPTHFLSYSWNYPLIDITDVARTISKTVGDQWGLWIDIFTINQHQGDRTHEDLSALATCIADIGRCVFVVDARGLALTRVWCIYEIMIAVRAQVEIEMIFIGKHRSAFDSAIIALTILAGRFDHIDVRDAEATIASDKALILKDVEQNPGIEALSNILKTTLRSHAQREFAKERFPFGSVWWCGPETFPSWVLDGFLGLIEEAGGWASLVVTKTDEERAFAEACTRGENVGKHEMWRPKYAGELDHETPLYQQLKTIITILTFGSNKPQSWDAVLRLVKVNDEDQTNADGCQNTEDDDDDDDDDDNDDDDDDTDEDVDEDDDDDDANDEDGDLAELLNALRAGDDTAAQQIIQQRMFDNSISSDGDIGAECDVEGCVADVLRPGTGWYHQSGCEYDLCTDHYHDLPITDKENKNEQQQQDEQEEVEKNEEQEKREELPDKDRDQDQDQDKDQARKQQDRQEQGDNNVRHGAKHEQAKFQHMFVRVDCVADLVTDLAMYTEYSSEEEEDEQQQ